MTTTAADIAPMTGGQDHVQLQASYRNGAGPHDCPSVVCLHASASSGRQWRALETRLAGRYRVSAPDLYGAGGSPPWPGEASLSLADEVARLEPIFAAAGESFHLVGHSYGGAVAAHAALANPDRIRSLVLIEPVLFGLLLADDPGQPAAREIAQLRDDTGAAAACGALEKAGERFTDYWMGPGAWAAMPPPRQAAVAQAMPGVRSEWSALLTDRTPLPAYSSLKIPTLYLMGSQSPVPAREVARLLTNTLPDVTTVQVDGAGHMAPITHPGIVGAAIEAHMARAG
jgi:pimeloyl-ACP methyl ester carboxylesterase